MGGERAAGARLGDGPMWNLRGALTKEEGVGREEVEEELKWLRLKEGNKTRAYIKQLEGEVERLKGGTNARCRRLLEQGLSQSADADVKFVFDDGRSPLSGHRSLSFPSTSLPPLPPLLPWLPPSLAPTQ